MSDATLSPPRNAPLIAHVVYRFGTGGLENGLVNLINLLPADRYRHVVICLTDFGPFRDRIRRRDVECIALNKREGRYPLFYPPLWKVLRRLRPDIVHTRNLAALEAQVPACLLGVPCRIHGEHGRDVFDLHGRSRRYNRLRRAIRPLVHQYIAVSRDLEHWLRETVAVPPARVAQIYNGVDTTRFTPRQGPRPAVGDTVFCGEDKLVIGTVGRMAEVKDPITLVRAFLILLDTIPEARHFLRLAIVGDGPQRGKVLALLDAAGAAPLAWVPGERDDVPRLLQCLDVFALPSLGEGISNTVLEAMSTGLPIVATAVGGNAELLDDGVSGRLVPPSDPAAMAQALHAYIADPALRCSHGRAARRRVERDFGLEAMVEAYGRVYDGAAGLARASLSLAKTPSTPRKGWK